jgi:ABC-type lipoprotein release transport system permease subunit
MLFGVTPLDLAPFLAASCVLLGAVAAAAWIAARRATRIDPTMALRHQ